MANFRKRGSKWQVQVRRAGFPSQTKTFERKDEAQAWARNREVAFDKAEAGVYSPPKNRLSDILARYLRDITPTKKSKASETRRIQRLLRDPISKKRICDLTPSVLATFRDRRLEDGLRAASYDLQIIRHALKVASAEWGMPMVSNPVAGISMPKPCRPRERRLKAGEYEALISTASESQSWFMAPLIVLAVETGMRLGEMLTMKWDDFDATHQTIKLRDTKNGFGRQVPLTQLAAETLGTLPVRGARIIPTNYDAVKSAWRRLCQRVSIDGLRFHDLRHEATSRFFEMGLTVPEVAAITGHRTPTMLLRYAHADARKLQAKLAQATSTHSESQRHPEMLRE